ncbi:MAG TPA: hypothetical protein VK797_22615 [Tepidisphaeraceae bacterium]|jgi:hypothetical protein|nr:hypothetical protein [Tepidisphaeraceae bacterium]
MGGQYQDTLSKAEAAGDVAVNDIRIHKSGDEVHLHDDQAGLKVAVPAPAFKDQLANLDDPDTPFVTFSDPKLHTTAKIAKDASGGDVTVTIEKTRPSGLWGKLKDFAGKL